jgi:hypothetical protein
MSWCIKKINRKKDCLRTGFALILSNILLVSTGWSQMTIVQTDLPEIGFRAAFIMDNTGNMVVDVGTIGGPQIWDFNQNLQGEILPYSILDPEETPYYYDFPHADQAILSMQQFQMPIPGFFDVDTLVPMYTYNQIVPGQFNLLGKALTTSIFSAAFPLDQPEIIQPVPLVYGSSWQTVNRMKAKIDTTYESIPVHVTITWNDTFDIDVDAFGTLNIPMGSFDVLREKIIYTQDISVSITLGDLPLSPVNQHKKRMMYAWVAKDYGTILQVTSNDTISPFDATFTDALKVIRLSNILSPSFDITVQPKEVTIYPGDSTFCSVSLTSLDQFNGSAQLFVYPSLPGLSGEFDPPKIDPNIFSQLRLKTHPSIKSGTYKMIVSGNSGTEVNRDTLTLKVLDFPYVHIYPNTDSTQIAGDEFWVDIFVGDSLRPVNAFYGTSFVLHYDKMMTKIHSPLTSSIVKDDFLGDPDEVLLFYPPENSITDDSLALAITRIYPDSSVYGWGSVMRIKFTTSPDTIDKNICFSISSARANDSELNPIILSPLNFCMEIKGLKTVWPGDTDNDGIVNQEDLLPVGICWDRTGSPRTGYANLTAWEPQQSRPWFHDVRCTYADANGDSVVDQNDVLVIGLNWNKTHALSKESHSAFTNTGKPGIIRSIILDDSQEGFVDLAFEVAGTEHLLGMGLEFYYPVDEINIHSVRKGSLLGENPLFFCRNDKAKGKLSIAITRIRNQGGISGSGCVFTVQMKIESKACLSQINFSRIIGMSETGNQFNLEIEPLYDQTNVTEDNNLPSAFVLYQNFPNPFNTYTTVKYELFKMSLIQIKVFDLMGTEVKMLVNKMQVSGSHEVIWDGRNVSGELVSSGIYYFSIRIGEKIIVRKGLLLK